MFDLFEHREQRELLIILKYKPCFESSNLMENSFDLSRSGKEDPEIRICFDINGKQLSFETGLENVCKIRFLSREASRDNLFQSIQSASVIDIDWPAP